MFEIHSDHKPLCLKVTNPVINYYCELISEAYCMTSGLAKRVVRLAAAPARLRPGPRVWSRISPTLYQAVTPARAYTPASPNPLQSAADPAKDKTIAYVSHSVCLVLCLMLKLISGPTYNFIQFPWSEHVRV